MQRFSFSLQKVLDVREFKKKQAQAELGKAVAIETQIQQTLDLIAQQRVDAVAKADTMRDIGGLYNVSRYFKLLDQRRDQMLTELTKAKIVTEEKRGVMREAMKQAKVLENLRDARFAAWKKESQKAEETFVDDIVTSRFGAGE